MYLLFDQFILSIDIAFYACSIFFFKFFIFFINTHMYLAKVKSSLQWSPKDLRRRWWILVKLLKEVVNIWIFVFLAKQCSYLQLFLYFSQQLSNFCSDFLSSSKNAEMIKCSWHHAGVWHLLGSLFLYPRDFNFDLPAE